MAEAEKFDGVVDAMGEMRTDLRRVDDRLRAVEQGLIGVAQRLIAVEEALPATGADEP